MNRPHGDVPWTDEDIREAADPEHPPSPEGVARVMPIVRAVLARQRALQRRRPADSRKPTESS